MLPYNVSEDDYCKCGHKALFHSSPEGLQDFRCVSCLCKNFELGAKVKPKTQARRYLSWERHGHRHGKK